MTDETLKAGRRAERSGSHYAARAGGRLLTCPSSALACLSAPNTSLRTGTPPCALVKTKRHRRGAETGRTRCFMRLNGWWAYRRHSPLVSYKMTVSPPATLRERRLVPLFLANSVCVRWDGMVRVARMDGRTRAGRRAAAIQLPHANDARAPRWQAHSPLYLLFSLL